MKTANQDPLAEFRGKLSIDKDDLDTGLVEQPDLYYHVAEAYVQAVAAHDAHKLALEQVTAEVDRELRQKAVDQDVKLTEVALKNKLLIHPKVKVLEEEVLHLKAEAARWLAMKEAFQQRSFMLRELVAIYVRRMGDLTLERGTYESRDALVSAHATANAKRREDLLLKEGSTPARPVGNRSVRRADD